MKQPLAPERWQRVKEIVADAFERTPNERAEFIAAACAGDDALRSEVESMVSQSADALERCAERIAAPAPARDPMIGTRLGAYEVVSEIGRGGMGAVYLARRADAEFEKQVAIKVLKRGTDTDEVLRRFRAERQILARLEHPNIAHLIDAGTTADGLPYFVMEQVEGAPITEYCRERNLGTRARVELILQVCGAVHFAHQNLVVHRDLKPRNILVTPEGMPKLLDFGIAKLLSDDSDAVQITVEGGQRLTPGYASPEQVRGDVVTTASDVYSLGALLYQLLAGSPPHKFETGNPTPTELFRVVVEQEPPRVTSIPADLDTILRKALSKEPQRRYSAVTTLAEDLRRHLDGRPVRARPATLGYRASKFVARNKLAVAGAALLLLTVAAGVAATVWQAREARHQAALAQRRFNDVRKLARAVVFDYDDLVKPLRGSTPVRERLVRDAIEYLDVLSREAGADRGLLREVATAYDKIGRVQGNSYYPNLGDPTGALQSYRKALDLRQQLLAAEPSNRELIGETADTHRGLGDVFYTIEDLGAAHDSYERAVALREPLVAAAPDDFTNRLSLAEAYVRLGDLRGFEHYTNLGDPAGGLAAAVRAQELLEGVYAKDPGNRDILSQFNHVLSHLGVLASATGDITRALEAQRRGVALIEELAAREPDSQQVQVELLAARHFLRFSIEDSGRLDEAIALSRRIIADLEQLLGADEKNHLFRRNLAVSYSALGRELLLAGDVPGALEKHRRATAMMDEMLAAAPTSTDRKKDAAHALWRLGQAQAAHGEQGASVESFRKALSLREPVLTSDPANMSARDDVASITADLGKALMASGEIAAAAIAFEKSLTLAEEISSKTPSNARYRARLAQRHADMGAFHRAGGNTLRGCESMARSASVWSELRGSGRLVPADHAKAEEAERQAKACADNVRS